MKILIVTDNYLPNIDGVVVSILNSSKYLEEKDHTICILAPKYKISDANKNIYSKGIMVHRFHSVPLPSYPNFRICMPNLRRLSKVIESFDPDLIHIHTLPGLLGIAGLFFAKHKKIPLITTYHASFPDV
ncbi:MAG: glycosyltransferase, partial [archaeon]